MSVQTARRRTDEERRRVIEVVAMVVTTGLLLGLSRLESGLFAVSERLAGNKDFVTSIAYFGLININVILILLLSFLIFRNVTKLVVERRRGVLGSKLRTKLVLALVFFALLPTAILVYISTNFITTSFENWFSARVTDAMQQTREAGALVYKQDQRRLESLARIALQRIELVNSGDMPVELAPRLKTTRLKGFENEYAFHGVKVYASDGQVVYSSPAGFGGEGQDAFALDAMERFRREPGLVSISAVEAENERDAVRGIAPVFDAEHSQLVGVVLTEELFETSIIRSIETILKEFGSLKPSAQLIRMSFLIMMIVMTLLIVFSATWLGFYVARGITGPIQSLAEATREVALGNYDITLNVRSDDETGLLVRSFNQMTADLKKHKTQVEESKDRLVKMNEELDQRRRHMEVVLKNIKAGVVAVDPKWRMTSINAAAERLLGLKAGEMVGSDVREATEAQLGETFWRPLVEGLDAKPTYHGQLPLSGGGAPVVLMVDGSRIFDENGVEQGVVVVFDDATAQVNMQRVAAWREVARRIAHEIKNPITPIKLSAQRLLRRFHDNFEGPDRNVFETCIETILVQVDSLRVLVSEFSKFSRLAPINPKPNNINAIIMDVVNLYRQSYPDITFDTSGMESLPEFPLDRDQMNRALVNIVTNAIAAVEACPGTNWIGFRSLLLPYLQTVRIEIADSGGGIPPELRERVLEPYFSTKAEGTGLGLAIVNQVVSDHGGYLRITDHEPRGTTVVIELPLGAVSATKTPEQRGYLSDG